MVADQAGSKPVLRGLDVVRPSGPARVYAQNAGNGADGIAGARQIAAEALDLRADLGSSADKAGRAAAVGLIYLIDVRDRTWS